MTSCGPYSLATIVYEPQTLFFTPVIDERTILGVLASQFPATCEMVHRAGFDKMYASPYPTTLFVDARDDDALRNLPKGDAVELCRARTCPRRVNAAALKTSACLVLKTLATPIDILIENFGELANGKRIVDEISCTNGIVHVLE